jgi:hypothetical protein
MEAQAERGFGGMKYLKTMKDEIIGEEITKEEAKEIISRYYTEKVASYDEMLEQRGTIPCMYCYIDVISD